MIQKNIDFLLNTYDMFLIHGTYFIKLESILKFGLKSTDDLDKDKIEYVKNYEENYASKSFNYNGFSGFKITKEDLANFGTINYDLIFIINPNVEYKDINCLDYPDEILIKSIPINNKTIISVIIFDYKFNDNKINKLINSIELLGIDVITLNFDKNGHIIKKDNQYPI